jgi:hypothetical protein
MPRTRCPQHPRRNVTHLVNPGTVNAADQLVCAECAQKAAQSREPGGRPMAHAQAITLVRLPTPVIVRGEQDPQGAMLHIFDEHVRNVGNVTRCGAVLKTWTVVKEDMHRANLCLACGALNDFETVAEAYVGWLETLPRRQ